MVFKKVLAAGSGVLGSQIAFQTAFHGYDVHIYDLNQKAIAYAKERLTKLKDNYKQDLGATQQEVDAAYNRIVFFTDLENAVEDVDLVIESVPEDPEIKKDFYKQLREVAPEKTIFATNTSTLLPSDFASITGRPKKFLALHFANEIWKNNTAEIMGHATTDKAVFKAIVSFAESIGMIPLELHKEQSGYLLNSLLVPLLDAAMDLLVKDVADIETIDKAWVIGTGAAVGPGAIFDTVGLNTVYNINKMKAEKSKNPWDEKVVAYIKEHFIDTGKLGVAEGQGFYKYPNPAYQDPDFYKK
ncbi:3-hydroxyacyl-CoA dehydrogenase [Flavobacterium sp. JP2137]|uniref:3-hydroxyacyl-CoA dehydrogenase n=1 Tax=Flavobacterium sp. JP2137 TaxID=3414510 RepID=UPI003D2FA197